MMGQAMEKHNGVSQQQKSNFEGDNHQESCSWARNMGDGTRLTSGYKARNNTKIRLTSGYSAGKTRKKLTSVHNFRSCSLLPCWTIPHSVWERLSFISNICGIYPAAVQKHYQVNQFPREWWQRLQQWFTNGVFVLPSVGSRRIDFCFLHPMEQEECSRFSTLRFQHLLDID